MKKMLTSLITTLSDNSDKFAEDSESIELLKKLRNVIDVIIYKSKQKNIDGDVR